MKVHSAPLLACTSLFLALATAEDIPALPTAPADSSAVETTAELEENPFVTLVKSLDWTTDGTGRLGQRATLQVPAGYQFTGNDGTVKLMEAYGNLTSGAELGYLSPDDMSWFAVFEFDDCGYVSDDEKDKLDADAILKQLRAGQQAANKELSARGMTTLQVVGWHTPPFYNPTTNNLEWAIRLMDSEGSPILNYKTKLLGRKGVMDVTLVCDESQISTIIPEYQNLLTGYSFTQEESYAAYRKGDKIAEYGLTGLILGGGLLVAAKSGLLAKLWKPIAIGLVAVGAFIKRIVTGKTRESV
ncbi:MAG: DUF2167 domain-containing protein [Verrucomicrobiales bacterium]|nr:DUF2167 domain-containing protein [Verrucomicrobiota bacterium JB022]